MPVKIRQLKQTLRKAGFVERSGKGSHTRWFHSLLPTVRLTISGSDGNDAQRYQIRDVETALAQLREVQEHE